MPSAFYPTRICLAGENVDWMLGPVVTAALDGWGVRASVVPRGARQPDRLEITGPAGRFYYTGLLDAAPPDGPAAYLRGAIAALTDVVGAIPPLDVAAVFDVPSSGGLSTSAALTSAIIAAAADALGIPLSRNDIAELSYRAEHDHVGVQCGRMDQAAIARGGLQFLDCSTAPPEGEALNAHQDLRLVVGCSASSMTFGAVYQELSERWARREPKIVDYAKTTAALAADLRVLCRGPYRLDELGLILTECQRLIRYSLLVENSFVAQAAQLALAAGATGAKSAGARRTGGSVVATADPDCAEGIAEAFRGMGAFSFVARVAPRWPHEAFSSCERTIEASQ